MLPRHRGFFGVGRHGEHHRRLSRSAREPSALPAWLWIPALCAIAFLLTPLLGLVTATDWSRFGALILSDDSLTALWLSIRTASTATVLVVILGVPLAYVLARCRFPGLAALRSFTLLPLVLPPVVGGIALIHAFGRRGLVGRYLELGGVSIGFTTVAVVMSQVFVSLPFLVISVEGALKTLGMSRERVAMTLGARPGRVFWRVTLPALRPALISGTVLAFARSLGEFGATTTFAGSLRGVTRTLPLEIYLQREVDPDAAVALSLLLMVFAFAVVALIYRRPKPLAGSRVGADSGAVASANERQRDGRSHD